MHVVQYDMNGKAINPPACRHWKVLYECADALGSSEVKGWSALRCLVDERFEFGSPCGSCFVDFPLQQRGLLQWNRLLVH